MVAKIILYILIALLAVAWIWLFGWAGDVTLQAILILFSIIASTCYCKCAAK